MLSTIVNSAKSAQIYPELPKSALRQLVEETFETPPKIEIFMIFINKNFFM
jgi:hypothetical protein